jgi:PAS domain S-box-containing protein
MTIPDRLRDNRADKVFWLALVVFLFALGAHPLCAQPAATPKRVLVLYWDNKDFPGNIKFDESFKAQLTSGAGNVEYYPEYMETTRFPGASQAFFHDYLRQKYEGRNIDVVLATADVPLNFIIQYRADLFPNAPIVFVSNDPPRSEQLAAAPGMTGIVNQSTYRQTMDLALKLHPGATQLYVISGTREHDRRFELVARQELAPFENRLKISYLTDLPLRDLLSKTASLPAGSIALYIWQQATDEQGKLLETYEVLARIAPTASVPIYGLGSGNLGQGIVGGYLQGPEQNGVETAKIVRRILSGVRPHDIPVTGGPTVPMFDWSQLKRWQINERQLPNDSVVRFRQFTFWELYKGRVIAVISLLLLQTAFILILLIERSRRRRAVTEQHRLNAVAEASHRRLGEIVSNVPGIVWESLADPLTKERKTTFISDHVQKMLGYTPEEWLAQPAGFGARILHDDDRERVLQESEEAFKSGRVGFSQFRWQAKDGRIVWTENYLIPITNGSGTVIGLRGVAIDISDRKQAEETARRTVEKDVAILAAIPDLMFLQTRDGVYLDYHANNPKDLLLPPEQFIGKNMRDVLPPELTAKFLQAFQQTNETGETQIIEYELPLFGEPRWFEARVVRSGENILTVVRDITQRVFIEKAIKRNEAQLAGIIDSAMDGIITVDGNQRIVLFNDAAEKVFDCPATEAVGQPIDRFIPERFRVAHREHIRGFAAPNVSRLMGGARGTLYGLKSSGEEFPMEASISRIDLSGQKFYTVILRDITERKQALDALRQSEERFGKAFRANPQPMSLTTLANGVYLDVNESFLTMSGYTREEVIGRTSLELEVWETPETRAEFVRELKEFGSVVNLETSFHTKAGSIRILLSSGEQLEIGGERCLLIASSDITDRKQAQQALQESEARFRNMADTAPVMIWMAGPDKLCNYFNQQWLNFTGRTIQQEGGNGWTEGIHRDDLARCLETFTTSFGARQTFEMEYRMRRADGEYRWILDCGTPRFSATGEFLGYIGSCLDITVRRESEVALRVAHEEVSRLKNQLQEENIYLQEEINLEHNFGEIIGRSDALKYVLFKIEQVAPTDSTVLITGETGTGKELVARAIHDASTRRDRPLVKVNCAALSPSLIESELFGHEKGAFTGASGRKIGRFELANGATIFLDEIGELPLELQVKLLRVIQEGELERLGSSQTIQVDARIIAATNRNLELEVNKGLFREDLWYRLNVFPITVPPLRQRREDISLLVEHFVRRFAKKLGKSISSASPATVQKLREYSWPGNVRELANVIERAVINSRGPALQLGDDFQPAVERMAAGVKTLEELERDYITRILHETGWRIEGRQGAALILGINPSTLRTRMNKLGIQKPGESFTASSG